MPKSKKVASKKSTSTYKPHDSMIIQIGVIFIFVAAIVTFAYAYANYGIVATMK